MRDFARHRGRPSLANAFCLLSLCVQSRCRPSPPPKKSSKVQPTCVTNRNGQQARSFDHLYTRALSSLHLTSHTRVSMYPNVGSTPPWIDVVSRWSLCLAVVLLLLSPESQSQITTARPMMLTPRSSIIQHHRRHSGGRSL